MQQIIAATNGNRHLVGSLREYPIPELRLPEGTGRLLDIGCNWGRWSIAAARKSYETVGVDPDLGAVLAARRVARQLDVHAIFVVGDARALPFHGGTFKHVFSYSVIQHFAKRDAVESLREVRRVLCPGGESYIQMPNALGIRSTYHLARRGFRDAREFEVRYWRASELRHVFTQSIGWSEIDIDGFFGLGIQPSDRHLMPRTKRAVINASEGLRRFARHVPQLTQFADSLYMRSRRA